MEQAAIVQRDCRRFRFQLRDGQQQTKGNMKAKALVIWEKAMDGKLTFIEATNKKGVAYRLDVKFVSHTGNFNEKLEGETVEAMNAARETYRRICEIADAEARKASNGGSVTRTVGGYAPKKGTARLVSTVSGIDAASCPTVLNLAAARKQQLSVWEAGKAEADKAVLEALLCGCGSGNLLAV